MQGSVLSPIILNFYIDNLLVKYTRVEIQPRAYADDIVWICKNKWTNIESNSNSEKFKWSKRNKNKMSRNMEYSEYWRGKRIESY